MKRWLIGTAIWGGAALAAAAGLGDLGKVGGLEEKLKGALPQQTQALLPVSEADEIAAGREVAANLLGASPLVADGDLQRYVNTVGRWVSLRSERPNLPWRFGIIQSDDINAFAAPGGYILVTRGLYRRLADESELAGVLGHEIAHVLKKHQLELMRKQTLIAEGGKALSAASDHNKVVQNLVGNGAEIFARRLDQDAEFEADRMGVVLATRAGYDPFGLPSVLQKLESVHAGDNRVQLLFKTHPLPAERLRRLDGVMTGKLLSLGGSGGGRLYLLR